MKSKYSSWKSKLIVMSKGMAMGTADIIPGVSGGTIALISGIYDHFIQALDSIQLRHVGSFFMLFLFFWDTSKRQKALQELQSIEWQFLLPLFFGIALALAIMINIIPYVMEHYSFYAFSFFFGLIVFSISVPYKRMQHGWKELLILFGFAIITFFLVSMSRVSDSYLDFVPDFKTQPDSESEIDFGITAKANQKGQWEISIPVELTIDSEDPICPGYTCFDLQKDSGFVIRNPDEKNDFPGERIMFYRARVEDSAAQPLGDFLIGVAVVDYSSKEFVDRSSQINTQIPASDSDNDPESDEFVRIVKLENNLKEMDFEIKQIRREIRGDLDLILIKGALVSEGDHSIWVLFLSGALAICAMVLPGISGAYILVLMGQYQYITQTIRDLVFNLKSFLFGNASTQLSGQIGEQLIIMIVFICGIVVGLFSFVRLLKYLLTRHHSFTMAALTGLMIGSLRYIWPPKHFEGTEMLWSHWLIFICIAIIGSISVFTLEYVANNLNDPDVPDPDVN